MANQMLRNLRADQGRYPFSPRKIPAVTVDGQVLTLDKLSADNPALYAARALAPYNPRVFVLTPTGVKISPEVFDLVTR